MEIKDQELTFNIRHDMHEEDWKDLMAAFEKLPGWEGVEPNGISYWYGKDEEDIHIRAFITFNGLVVEGNMPDAIWAKWILNFIEKISEALGFEVKSIYHD